MHNLEPYFKWLDEYSAALDERSPFYGRTYSEFEFTNSIYNYAIHPQWDAFGSETLFLKILYADYQNGFCVIELLGEWNDCIENSIAILKANVIDVLISAGINKFILIGENVLNFHAGDDCYYQEWSEELIAGWIAGLNFREHILDDMRSVNVDYYIKLLPEFSEVNWRMFRPMQLFAAVQSMMPKAIRSSST